MKINVKGKDYTIEFVDNVFLSSDSRNILNGECSALNRKIKIDKSLDNENLEAVITHELIHAYLYECGLLEFGSNETLVTWLGWHIKDILSDCRKIKRELDGNNKRSS